MAVVTPDWMDAGRTSSATVRSRRVSRARRLADTTCPGRAHDLGTDRGGCRPSAPCQPPPASRGAEDADDLIRTERGAGGQGHDRASGQRTTGRRTLRAHQFVDLKCTGRLASRHEAALQDRAGRAGMHREWAFGAGRRSALGKRRARAAISRAQRGRLVQRHSRAPDFTEPEIAAPRGCFPGLWSGPRGMRPGRPAGFRMAAGCRGDRLLRTGSSGKGPPACRKQDSR